MPLSLEDILKQQYRVSINDTGLTAIHHFLPKQEIDFLLFFENDNYFKQNYKHLKSALLETAARSNFIEIETKNRILVSSSSEGLHLIIQVDKNNHLPFENIEHFIAFSKDLTNRFFNSGIKRSYLKTEGEFSESTINKRIAATSFLANKFLKAEKLNNPDISYREPTSLGGIVVKSQWLDEKAWPLKDFIDYSKADFNSYEIQALMDKLVSYKQSISTELLMVRLDNNLN